MMLEAAVVLLTCAVIVNSIAILLQWIPLGRWVWFGSLLGSRTRLLISCEAATLNEALFEVVKAPRGLQWADLQVALAGGAGQSSAVRLLVGQPHVHQGDRFEVRRLESGTEYSMEIQFGEAGPSCRHVFRTQDQWFEVV